MKRPIRAPSDKQWIYGIIIWAALSFLAYILMLPFRLLLSNDSPHSSWQIGTSIILAIVLMAIAPVLLYRVCSYFVHLAENPVDSAVIGHKNKDDGDVPA